MALVFNGLLPNLLRVPRAVENLVPKAWGEIHPLRLLVFVYYLPTPAQQFRVVIQHFHFRDKGGYDNVHPRAQLRRLLEENPLALRAQSAYENGLETSPQFALAILAAYFAGVDKRRVTRLGVVYAALRILFTLCYLCQTGRWAFAISAFRSTFFMCAQAVTFQLFMMAIEADKDNQKSGDDKKQR